MEYLTFEGVIPKGEYGGGTMIVWDQGRWIPDGDPRKGYAKGHLDFHRVLWPDVGVTKEGLAEFYAAIADWVLPHVVDRLLALVRCPSGTSSKCFFEKHAWDGIGRAIKRRDIGGDEVLFIDGLDGLIALVQASVLEKEKGGRSRPGKIRVYASPCGDSRRRTGRDHDSHAPRRARFA
jgi:hypothetical protein